MDLKVGIYPSIDGAGYWETTIGDISRSDSNLLLYHKSWDWLMPVVEKIESLSYNFEKNYQPVDKDWQCLITKGNDIMFQEFHTDSKLAAHYVVTEFIKWYNKNKQS